MLKSELNAGILFLWSKLSCSNYVNESQFVKYQSRKSTNRAFSCDRNYTTTVYFKQWSSSSSHPRTLRSSITPKSWIEARIWLYIAKHACTHSLTQELYTIRCNTLHGRLHVLSADSNHTIIVIGIHHRNVIN